MAWRTKDHKGAEVIWYSESEFNEVKNENIRLKEKINDLKTSIEINKTLDK